MAIHELYEHPMDPELATDDPPISDEDLAEYHQVLELGPNAELRPDGTEDPDTALAVARASDVHGWSITSLSEAEWAMAKLATTRARIRDMEAHRDEVIRRAQEWYERAARDDLRSAEFFRWKLEDWGHDQRATGATRGTIPLVGGEVRTTQSGPKVEVTDDAELAAFLDEQGLAGDPDLVKWTAKVYVGPLRKLVHIGQREDSTYAVVTEAGEPVPGVWVKPGGITVKVVPS